MFVSGFQTSLHTNVRAILEALSVLRSMPRKLRYLPEESLVEVTCRTIQGRLLLRPSRTLNALIIGVLARAQQATGMKVCGFVYMSNHCHLLLRPSDAFQMAAFMRFVNSNIAREVARLHSWREKIWGRRYVDIVVSHERQAQLGRLRYLLEQGVKERLVESPLRWPGAQSSKCLARGEVLRGIWIDRTAQYRARLRCEPAEDQVFASAEALELSPLPCLEELSEPERQTLVRGMIREICRDAASERAGRRVMGRRAVLEQDPTSRPRGSKRSPAPRFHAIEPRVRKALEVTYHLFRLAHRRAREEIRSGLKAVTFPAGSFPGPGRFVPLRS